MYTRIGITIIVLATVSCKSAAKPEAASDVLSSSDIKSCSFDFGAGIGGRLCIGDVVYFTGLAYPARIVSIGFDRETINVQFESEQKFYAKNRADVAYTNLGDCAGRLPVDSAWFCNGDRAIYGRTGEFAKIVGIYHNGDMHVWISEGNAFRVKDSELASSRPTVCIDNPNLVPGYCLNARVFKEGFNWGVIKGVLRNGDVMVDHTNGQHQRRSKPSELALSTKGTCTSDLAFCVGDRLTKGSEFANVAGIWPDNSVAFDLSGNDNIRVVKYTSLEAKKVFAIVSKVKRFEVKPTN